MGMKGTKLKKYEIWTKRWMESFINKNTESRAKADNDFGKRLIKDMNGKTMEHVKKEQKLVLNMINVLKGYLNLAFAE